jgi:hypothetical protein
MGRNFLPSITCNIQKVHFTKSQFSTVCKKCPVCPLELPISASARYFQEEQTLLHAQELLVPDGLSPMLQLLDMSSFKLMKDHTKVL